MNRAWPCLAAGCFLRLILPSLISAGESSGVGYYRYPAIHGQDLVFTAEGDLWRVGIHGGLAQRLTSHLGEESTAAFSRDGQWVAFSAQYEGAREVYVMPASGGLPKRLTFEGANAIVAGWTPDGKVLYSTTCHSTLPDWQLATLDLKTGTSALLPLSQASDGCFDPSGRTLFLPANISRAAAPSGMRAGRHRICGNLRPTPPKRWL
jgi:tricorn protease